MQNETLAQSFVRYVHEDLQQVKQPHFDIAFRLDEAKRLNYPAELGYKDIYELSEVEFGFKRSTTAAYIAVCVEYMSGMKLSSYWTAYSFSQLVEMLPMDEYDRKKIVPTATVKQIREWRRDHKFVTLENGDCVLYGELSQKQRKEYEDFRERQKAEKKSVQTSGQIMKLRNLLSIWYMSDRSRDIYSSFDELARYLVEQGVTL